MRFDSRGLVSTYLSQWMPLNDVTRQSVAGYVGGGFDGALISGIDKITFPADTKTTLSATLSTARDGSSGMADCGVF